MDALKRMFTATEEEIPPASTEVTRVDQKNLPTDAIGKIVVVIEVLAAKDLIAKDRNLLGKRTTSDPYVKVYRKDANGVKHKIGKTAVQSKTLDPVWNHKMDCVVDGDDRLLRDGLNLVYDIYDSDFGRNDGMGTVEVHVDLLQPVTDNWYVVGTGQEGSGDAYCHNATGKVHLIMSVSGRCVPALRQGNSFNLDFKRDLNAGSTLNCGFAWNSTITNAYDIYFLPSLSDGTVVVQNITKASLGSKFQREIALLLNPDTTMYCLSLPRTSTGDWSSAFRVRFFAQSEETAMCEFRPRYLTKGRLSMLFRITYVHEEGAWKLEPIDFALSEHIRDLGAVFPIIQSLQKEEMDPAFLKNPTALLLEEGSMMVDDYVPDSTEGLRFEAYWRISEEHDFDLSVICLDKQFAELEIVSFRQLLSRDKAIKHCGDRREDNLVSRENDEVIQVRLDSVADHVKHIVFVVNSHSGALLEISDVFSFHLVNQSSAKEIACHSVQRGNYVGGKVSLVMAGFSRHNHEDRWKFEVFDKAFSTAVEHNRIEHLQELLKHVPHGFLSYPAQESDLCCMPMFEPLPRSKEDVMIPSFEFARYLVENEIELEGA